MRLVRPPRFAFALALALAACSRSALEEELRDSTADAAKAPADAASDVGPACGRGVLCGTSMTCPAGEELCNVGCPERQNFAPPACMPGPCPPTNCPTSSGDAASP